MKRIRNDFSWYPRTEWYWPNHDEKLIQVNDWVRDADIALKHTTKRSLVIQAGGACGVWPVYFSKHFKQVVTFEPVKSNIECLKKNIEGYENISFFPCALSSDGKPMRLDLDDSEKNNCGAYHYSSTGVRVPSMRIDDIKIKDCALICLDLEGMEYDALVGASETIEKFSPVIMIEEKPLPYMDQGDHLFARQYLESLGYKQVDSIHRDLVFKR